MPPARRGGVAGHAGILGSPGAGAEAHGVADHGRAVELQLAPRRRRCAGLAEREEAASSVSAPKARPRRSRAPRRPGPRPWRCAWSPRPERAEEASRQQEECNRSQHGWASVGVPAAGSRIPPRDDGRCAPCSRPAPPPLRPTLPAPCERSNRAPPSCCAAAGRGPVHRGRRGPLRVSRGAPGAPARRGCVRELEAGPASRDPSGRAHGGRAGGAAAGAAPGRRGSLARERGAAAPVALPCRGSRPGCAPSSWPPREREAASPERRRGEWLRVAGHRAAAGLHRLVPPGPLGGKAGVAAQRASSLD